MVLPMNLVRLERARRAAADAARLSGPQVVGGATIDWVKDLALTSPQREALVELAGELGDSDLIEYGASDVRRCGDETGDVTVFVTELRGRTGRVIDLDEEGGRHDG